MSGTARVTEQELLDAKALNAWVAAISQVATHYRLTFSPGGLQAMARWQLGKPLATALKNMARHIGLSSRMLDDKLDDVTGWRLPLVVQLKDGQVAIIHSFDGEANVGVSFSRDADLITTQPLTELLAEIRHVIAFRPAAMARDSRTEEYLSSFDPGWLRQLVMVKIKPYWHVMLASLVINVLSMAGILFSMQVYDRVIPAQSYPTLYVLFIGVLIAVAFGFAMRLMRSHVTDILGKQADMRISDRVFGHALRLRTSAVPRSTGSFISQLRELESIREMVTSTTVSVIADLPFFFLFLLVMAIIAPQLAWIAPVAAIIMLAPGLLLQRKLAALAQEHVQESTLRNAVLVESVQGLEDIKLMQAETRFLQQWNSYIRITAQTGMKSRRLTQGLLSWGTTIQGLVYAVVIVVGAPMVINGDITTGAIVAASQLSSRMIAPMAALCGVLARWQQAKAAKSGIDSIMQLPVENGEDSQRLHRDVLHGNYLFTDTAFRYRPDSPTVPLRVGKLEINAGERIAVLGRNGAGKSTFLQALIGGVPLEQGELRLDSLSLPHIDVADLRRNTGLMTQNARLFHGSLRDNLTLGAPQARDEEIIAALEMCGADVLVRKLPHGLDHVVMEGGLGLSGGQRQSLLLARLILRDPNIVLLDEPTASLDEHTERDFLDRLGNWLAGRTLIIATHRSAVLSIVNRVLVLKDGALVMDMPKEQAMARKGADVAEVHNERRPA
ncbi:type I secretion system permease/ATPase [Kluyvera intermedia]|uniref:Type I secretion system permease/ATPase n=1 Tax=Kluyvera intermedia TaxID=61648 RepID=A0ABX6DXJ7_KLUIN|nr:type I secretion system permease/ATPase [Kluyvera intermedia]QGH31625.1 type I secretion system permease/ATPase [Kluyvera intermedia]QGH40607.1 type I secretion system permease/ATPase [Kluyvera intermedia]